LGTDADRTIANLTAAIESDPSDAIAYCERAVKLAIQGQRDKAMTDLNRAIELRPSYSMPYYYRGTLYELDRAGDKAIADMTKAIELGKEDAETYTGRAMAYLTTGPQRSMIDDLIKASKLDASHPSPRFYFGFVLRTDWYCVRPVKLLSKLIELELIDTDSVDIAEAKRIVIELDR
jgi:tetratricopeptide (TPR) repeat protein